MLGGAAAWENVDTTDGVYTYVVCVCVYMICIDMQVYA